MIYLDTSVALAHLLAEDRRPPAWIWDETLVSSRLLEFELWSRIHARDLGATHAEDARELVARIAFLEMVPLVLARAREPFPTPVRTLDALHLASADFLRTQGQHVQLATYDARLRDAARSMDLDVTTLGESRGS